MLLGILRAAEACLCVILAFAAVVLLIFGLTAWANSKDLSGSLFHFLYAGILIVMYLVLTRFTGQRPPPA